MHGQGVYTYKNGVKYEGEFYNGKLHGYGVYTKPNGQVYEGQWENNKRNGMGTYVFTNGTKWKGMWAENEPQDEGKYAFINGEARVGPLEKRYAHLEPEQSKPPVEIVVVPEPQKNVNNNPEETQNLGFSGIVAKNSL